jgi:hypothetical protein
MKNLVATLILLSSSLFSNAQGFTTFEPIIPSRPQPIPVFYDLPQVDYEAENNQILVNYILKLQSQILDIKLTSTDKGFNNILDKYYRQLDGLKSNVFLYSYEDELINLPINLKNELVNYINENQHFSDSKESNNEFEIGLVSSYYINGEWDYVEKRYVQKSTVEMKSKLYITDKIIFYKKGSNDWLVNKWEYDNINKESKMVTFFDERNQMVCFDEKLTMLMYFYDYDGEIFRKVTHFGDLTFDPNVVQPF